LLHDASSIIMHCSDTKDSSTAPEPSYELVKKSSDVELKNNPVYSISATQGSSEDHHYDVIPARHHATAK